MCMGPWQWAGCTSNRHAWAIPVYAHTPFLSPGPLLTFRLTMVETIYQSTILSVDTRQVTGSLNTYIVKSLLPVNPIPVNQVACHSWQPHIA